MTAIRRLLHALGWHWWHRYWHTRYRAWGWGKRGLTVTLRWQRRTCQMPGCPAEQRRLVEV